MKWEPAEMFRSVRWRDGRFVSYRQDSAALGVHLLSAALMLVGFVSLAASWSWPPWWTLVLATVGLELIARCRLHRAKHRVEALGAAGQDDIKADFVAQVDNWVCRYDDWALRYTARDYERYQARAEAARSRGDHKSAAKFLRRADYVRRIEQWSERIVQERKSRRSAQS